MNHAEVKANAAVMQAYVEGKTIQNRRRGSTGWLDVSKFVPPDFTFATFEYRVKPEPEQFFITVYGDDARAAVRRGCAGVCENLGVGGTYSTAFAAGQGGVGDHRIFKVVEVTK